MAKSSRFLKRDIQKNHGSTGHDSVEDARATLDLVKLKTEHGPAFGAAGADDGADLQENRT